MDSDPDQQLAEDALQEVLDRIETYVDPLFTRIREHGLRPATHRVYLVTKAIFPVVYHALQQGPHTIPSLIDYVGVDNKQVRQAIRWIVSSLCLWQTEFEKPLRGHTRGTAFYRYWDIDARWIQSRTEGADNGGGDGEQRGPGVPKFGKLASFERYWG